MQVEVAGRANLIGEYTDLNGGPVLPVALAGLTVRIEGARESAGVELSSADAVPDAYVDAVIRALRDEERPVLPLRGRIEASLPPGAGLSSSAALTVALALALDGGEPPLEPLRLAQLCQRAENDYVGVPCGIMDPLAVVCGRAGHALLIDCAELTVEPVPFPDGLSLLIAHSGVERRLADGAYAQLARDFAAARERLGIARLAAIDPAELDGAVDALPERLARRVRHVVSETTRVEAFAAALAAGNAPALGDILTAAHESLRADLGVSTPEIDELVRLLRAQPGAIGARLTGAGFGGCAIALVEDEPGAEALDELAAEYRRATGREARFWLTRPGDGIVANRTAQAAVSARG